MHCRSESLQAPLSLSPSEERRRHVPPNSVVAALGVAQSLTCSFASSHHIILISSIRSIDCQQETGRTGQSDPETYIIKLNNFIMVAAGASAVHDELAQLKSLKDKKGDFESSCKEVDNVEKKTQVSFTLPGSYTV